MNSINNIYKSLLEKGEQQFQAETVEATKRRRNFESKVTEVLENCNPAELYRSRNDGNLQISIIINWNTDDNRKNDYVAISVNMSGRPGKILASKSFTVEEIYAIYPELIDCVIQSHSVYCLRKLFDGEYSCFKDSSSISGRICGGPKITAKATLTFSK